MKRYTPRILLCLFLGIITTVVVSVVCVFMTGFGKGVNTAFGYKKVYNMDWSVFCFQSFGNTSYLSYIGPNGKTDIERDPGYFLPKWSDLGSHPHIAANANTLCLMRANFASGWPARSFWCELTEPNAMSSTYTTRGAIDLHRPASGLSKGIFPQVIPYKPIWYGVFINTATYSVLWFVAGQYYVKARCARRTRQGQCPKCGYDLRGDFESGCSECGWNRTDTKDI